MLTGQLQLSKNCTINAHTTIVAIKNPYNLVISACNKLIKLVIVTMIHVYDDKILTILVDSLRYALQ